MTFHNFAYHLAQELHRMAVETNARADIWYSTQPHSSYEQDCAFELCCSTARLAEFALDCLMDVEEATADARRAA